MNRSAADWPAFCGAQADGTPGRALTLTRTLQPDVRSWGNISEPRRRAGRNRSFADSRLLLLFSSLFFFLSHFLVLVCLFGGLGSSHRYVLRWCLGSEPAILRLVVGSGAALGLDPGGDGSHSRPGEFPDPVSAASPHCTGKKTTTKQKTIICIFLKTDKFCHEQ